MIPQIGLLHLLRYRIALDRILADLHSERTRGKGLGSGRLPVEALLSRSGLSNEAFRRDTEMLGLVGTIEVEAFTQAVSGALQHEINEQRQDPPPSLPAAEAGTLFESLQQPEDRSLARIREEAWAYASAFSNDWLLGLSWFAKDKAPFAHQFKTAKRVVNSMSGNAIIADEVGLGKTITAGLIMAELQLRGLADALLIIVPPNLKQQWLDELAAFFDFHPALIKSSSPSALQHLAKAPAVLIDYYRARSKDCTELLLDRRWSLLIVDEAHRLRNPDTEQSRIIYSIPAVRRLFLTATPVQNAATDIHQLVSHLRPGLLGSRSAFVDHFVGEDGTVREEESLKHRIAEVQTRTRREETELRFPKREIKLVPVEIASSDERALYESVLGFVQQIERHYSGSIELAASGRVRQARSIVLLAIQVLRQLSSHPKGAIRTLHFAMRTRLNKLPATIITREDLKRLDDLVRRFGKLDWSGGRHAKTQALVRSLPHFLEASHKTVVYAEFLETISSLRESIQADAGVKPALLTYTGRLSRANKKAVIDRFHAEKKPTILLSTDSGGEGLNLQEAGAVVNFDFPWNPMRVEQRIGRVDRLGQKRSKVFVWNMITAGTIEWYVYSVLQDKLDVCRKVVGDLDSPITRVMMRRKDEDLGIGQIILSARDHADLETKLKLLYDPAPESVRDYGRKSPIVF
ncbi:MAG: DEAD/DEAH box helicase [Acidobacteriia bacterium]|nr:DEAD/DEAH box helicase [Terriglobia bacterium]